MKKPKNTQKIMSMDTMKALGQKYGVKVNDMSERGVRAIGILGGVGLRLGTHRPKEIDPKIDAMSSNLTIGLSTRNQMVTSVNAC
jgi:hypothetical protein